MGMFFLLRDGSDADARKEAAIEIAARMGLGGMQRLSAAGYTLYLFPKRSSTKAQLIELPNGDFVAACGTFIFKRRAGEAALHDFYDVFDGDFTILEETLCHFAIIILKRGVVHVSGDQVGGYHIFRDALMTIMSSSFLVGAALVDQLTVTRQSLYEYIFNGVVSGNETLVAELDLVPVGASVSIAAGEAKLEQPRLNPPREALPLARQELIKRSFTELETLFGTIVDVFGDRITCALSGGFDSRLILAMLRRLGSRPRAYVYGKQGDPDVVISSAIASGEGFALEVVDKDQRKLAPDQFGERVARNFLATDGYLWGGIFNNGAEEEQRARRVSGGAIALNGGGGEILRNFFFLLDRRYAPRELLWSFFAQFDPAVGTKKFDSVLYFRDLERKVLELVRAEKTLERPAVEWLYHRFRCRSWDGRVDTINAQFGHTGLPFLSTRITDLAARIPIRWKYHGAFEAELIRIADSRLAAYTSTHGHNFLAAPPARIRLRNFATYLRPPFLRRLSYRVQNRYSRHWSSSIYLRGDYVREALPDGVEALRSFFRLDRVNDPAQMSRILSVEYLARRFGSRLRFE